MLGILHMPILVLCPNCRHRTEKMRVLNQIARGDTLYRCPACGTICTEPNAPVIGQPVALDDRGERDRHSD